MQRQRRRLCSQGLGWGSTHILRFWLLSVFFFVFLQGTLHDLFHGDFKAALKMVLSISHLNRTILHAWLSVPEKHVLVTG